MIVRRFEDRLQLITQPEHAQLAGRIMAHCAPLAAHPRREAILHAIAEHDNGWTEEDASPGVDPETGDVIDFVNAPLTVRHAVWQRGIARLKRDPWVAALVAQHAIAVYERFRSDREWDGFFARMEGIRDELLRVSGRPLAELLDDYVFVRLGDLVSLTFCTGWQEAQRFGRWKVRLAGDRILVSPDDFACETIRFEIDARHVPNRPFRSQADLMEALRRAASVPLAAEVIPVAD